MKNKNWIWLFLLPIFWSSCRTDFDTVPSTGNLEFSRDTVFLDTVFSNIGSSTYTLKVYNPSKEDISVPNIRLGNGEDSNYRLNVDGISGKSFKNIEILARDSIFIFVETTLDINEVAEADSQFLYTDNIEFDAGEHLQKVPLITLVKDAVFLYPKKYQDGSIETIHLGQNETGEDVYIEGFFLEGDDLNFSQEKPYVIYGYAAVPQGKTLRIEAGSRIHFHDQSGLIVSEGASLQAQGEYSENQDLLEKEIIFEGDRLEPRFSDVPGQWGAIWLTEGSINNSFRYTTIKNADIGLWVDGNAGLETSPLFLKNIQIYNSSVTAILARNANIMAENLVINNSGQASLHIIQGGKYIFKHSTITNYWQQGLRMYPALLIESTFQSEDQANTAALIQATFSNCIVYGNQDQEIFLNIDGDPDLNFKFENSLLKFIDTESSYSDLPQFDFSNPQLYENSLFNQDPKFLNPHKNQLQLLSSSPAIDVGKQETALEVPLDILKVSRFPDPDLGAYEWTEETELP